jgi:hypothetical protein
MGTELKIIALRELPEATSQPSRRKIGSYGDVSNREKTMKFG